MTIPIDASEQVARLFDKETIDATEARGRAIGLGLAVKQVMGIDLRSKAGWHALAEMIEHHTSTSANHTTYSDNHTTRSCNQTTHQTTGPPNQTTQQTTSNNSPNDRFSYQTIQEVPMTDTALPKKLDFNAVMAQTIEKIQRSDLQQFKETAQMQVALVEASVEADRIVLRSPSEVEGRN